MRASMMIVRAIDLVRRITSGHRFTPPTIMTVAGAGRSHEQRCGFILSSLTDPHMIESRERASVLVPVLAKISHRYRPNLRLRHRASR